jgi:hypothetical protein
MDFMPSCYLLRLAEASLKMVMVEFNFPVEQSSHEHQTHRAGSEAGAPFKLPL